jgi:hypothetical protein
VFGSYFKASLKALPFIVLLPIVICALYVYVVNPNFVQLYTISDDMSHGVWVDESTGVDKDYIVRSMVTAGIVNFVLLMIIPCAIGGTNPGVKRALFYMGFFLTLALSLVFPIIYTYRFLLDGITNMILIALHIGGFLLPFILGALFVAPAYARAFWFVNRK